MLIDPCDGCEYAVGSTVCLRLLPCERRDNLTKVLKINGKKTARVRIVSDMSSDICFDITVPEDCVDKLKDLVPKCSYEWYNNPDYMFLGPAMPLCQALDKQGIPYILHEDVTEEPDDWAEF